MHRASSFVVLAALSLPFALVALPGPADACCPAFKPGERVAIASQEILVAYDTNAKREHFVRRAGFRTGDTQQFGFLVPTPTQPELAEAPDAVFDRLGQAIEPRVEWIDEHDLQPTAIGLLFLAGRASEPTAAVEARSAGAVNVLERTTVAGFDAAVLEASDADALTAWLRANDYEARPELTEWVRPYVAAGWKVTAFKYAADGRRAIATGAIRMSFDTDTPLFPFRVPTDQIAELGRGNLLRVFYVGGARVEGGLGAGRFPWNARTKFAAEVPEVPALLEGAVPGSASFGAGAWLTAFEDDTWPSGTEDLFFAPAKDPSPVIPVVKRPRRVPLFIPLDVIAVVCGLGVLVWRRTRAKDGGRAGDGAR